jgi:hypothetical protein
VDVCFFICFSFSPVRFSCHQEYVTTTLIVATVEYTPNPNQPSLPAPTATLSSNKNQARKKSQAQTTLDSFRQEKRALSNQLGEGDDDQEEEEAEVGEQDENEDNGNSEARVHQNSHNQKKSSFDDVLRLHETLKAKIEDSAILSNERLLSRHHEEMEDNKAPAEMEVLDVFNENAAVNHKPQGSKSSSSSSPVKKSVTNRRKRWLEDSYEEEQ